MTNCDSRGQKQWVSWKNTIFIQLTYASIMLSENSTVERERESCGQKQRFSLKNTMLYSFHMHALHFSTNTQVREKREIESEGERAGRG